MDQKVSMDTELSSLLEKGLSEIDSSLVTESRMRFMNSYYDSLIRYNPMLKLVGAEGRDLVIKHFLDCLAPVPIIKRIAGEGKVSCADLGSGNGLPGLILSSAFEEWDFSLVDRMSRRVTFLIGVVAKSGFKDHVRVVESDLERLEDTFDCVVFRAFRQFKDIAVDLARIVRKNGFVFAYKSSEDNIKEELEVLERKVPGCFETSEISYSVPFLEAKRTLLVLKRV